MELKSFVIELTGDGSPTLRLKNINSTHPEKMPESMHHSGGAAAETLYIYQQPFKNTLIALANLKKMDLSVGVVGLGLGYIELSILQSLTENASIVASLTSFEKESELVDNFSAWLDGAKNETYDLICQKLSIEQKSIFLKKNFLTFQGELKATSKIEKPFHFVAYDAFSQFTDGPMWTDEFLDFFLKDLCANDCVFTTYACTGLLKRALKRNGFLFLKRLGFSGKRDATLALRGEFVNYQHLYQNA